LQRSASIAVCLRNIANHAALRLSVGEFRRRDMEIVMKIALAAIAFMLAASAAACNTVEGVGQDTQAAGEAIEDAADDNK
jgi:predicted small secreted protein